MIRPILFNTELVRTILDGKKTVTRRVVKLPKYVKDQKNGLYTLFTEGTCYENQHFEQIVSYIKKPCRPEDILYVRETWTDHYVPNEEGKPELQYCYKADGIDIKAECLPGENNRWYPSIHMPKEAARIFLKVTDVRVERLQEISEYQIVAEGTPYDKENYAQWKRGDVMTYNAETYLRKCYRDLWNSTIKKSDLDCYGWDANPWVWVIEFERCEKPEEWGAYAGSNN